MPKYPEEYTKIQYGEPDKIFTPHYLFDSKGRLILPLTPHHRLILKTVPGSRDVSQSSESETGKPETDPGSLKTGYLYASTAIKAGPEGGWVAQISGGDSDYPFVYWNETTKEWKFYVDKSGNVGLKGSIEAIAGSIGGWTIATDELYASVSSEGNTYRIGLKPTTYPFYAYAPVVNGVPQPENAPFRVDSQGRLWCTSVQTLSGPDIGNLAHLDQVGSDQILDNAVTELKLAAQAVTNAKIALGAIHGDVIATGAITETKIANDSISTPKLQAGSIIAAKIATGAVTAEKIEAGAITSEKIAAGAVTADKITVSQLSAISANIGTITAGTVTGVVVRTAFSGARVQLDSTNYLQAYDANYLRVKLDTTTLHFYDASGNEGGQILGQGGKLYFSGPSSSSACFEVPLWMEAELIPDTVRDLIPTSSNTYDLGASTYKWRNLYLSSRLYGYDLDLSYGRIYQSGNLMQDMWLNPTGRPTGWTTGRELRLSSTLTPHTNCYEHIGWRNGYDGATTNRIWRVVHFGWSISGGCSEGGILASSPIRVENSALDVIKKVKPPKFFQRDKLTCEYGLAGSEPGKYFTEDEFPEEMKMLYPGKEDKKSQIELFRSVGILTQGLKELTEKVERLERIYNSNRNKSIKS